MQSPADQRLVDHLTGNPVFADDCPVCAMIFEMLDRGVALRPRDDAQARMAWVMPVNFLSIIEGQS